MITLRSNSSRFWRSHPVHESIQEQLKPLIRTTSSSSSLRYYFSSGSNQDYYKMLGVTPNSKKADIKSAFFKLAKKYHPDTNPTAGDKFKELNEAYQILSDDDKRAVYDAQRSSQSSSSSSSGGGYGFHQGASSQRGYSGSSNENMNKRYQETQRAAQNDNFFYYWETQNPQGRQNYNQSSQAHNAYQQQQQQQEQYRRAREAQRMMDEARLNEAMKDFMANMYSGKNPKYNAFQSQYNPNGPKYTNQQQQQYSQQQQQRQQNPWGNVRQEQEYAYDPHDYYQKNWDKQAQRNAGNSYYQSHSSFSQQRPGSGNPQKDWDDQYEAMLRRQEEQDRAHYRAEEKRRQQEYEDWQRKKDEMFMKEVGDKVESIKNNVKNVASTAEKTVKDIGSKVMSFFKNK